MSFAVAVAPLAYAFVSVVAVGVVYSALVGLSALVRAIGGGRSR